MREHAHQLLDQLDEPKLAAVVHLLEAFIEDDPDTLTSDEQRMSLEAQEWMRHNEPTSHEDLMAEYGLVSELSQPKP